MLISNCKVVDVTAMLASVPGVLVAESEAQLESTHRRCSLYTLGPHPQRYAISLPALRANLVKCAESVGGFFVADRMPAFRPCPVLCLKNLFDESDASADRCRVCWDIDTEGDGLPCAPEHLLSLLCGFLRERVVGCEDWDTEEAWVWYGAFADKRASYHVYFPRMVWGRRASNVYKLQDFTALADSLKPYGLKVDTSITTSGIKVLGSDKWLAKTHVWRGDVQRLQYIRNGPARDLVTWEDAFAHCFAIACPGDVGYDREVNWRDIVRVPGGEAVQKRSRVVEVVAAVGATTPDSRLYAAVPEWVGCKVKHIHKENGVVFVVPQSTFCPLKRDASNDQPAFQHAMPGKTFVVRDVLGEQRVLCHVCSGKELLIPVPAVEASAELDAKILRHFAGWARFTPGRVLRLPSAEAPCATCTYNEFIAHHTRHNETVRIGKSNMPWPKYWLQLAEAPSYPYGFIFDPSCAPNPGYFNQFQGFAYKVVDAHNRRANELAAMSTEQLIAECPAWHSIVRHNVCRDDVDLYRYFHSWMADCVQRPEVRSGIALMILGPPGCGKGLSLRAMMALYGRHALQTNDLSTKWTAVYEDKVYIFADEALAPKDKFAQQRLLSLITEEELCTERKNRDLVSNRLYGRIAIASNRPKAVPLQPGERRYAIFGADYIVHPRDTDEARACFAKAGRELETPDCLAALLEFWQRWPLQDVNLRAIPVTEAGFRAQYAMFNDYERFVYHWLLSGNLCLREIAYDAQNPDHTCADSLYAESARKHGNHDVRAFATTGYNVWRCEHCAVPKFAFATAFTQMCDVRNPDVPLWKFLHDLSKHSQDPLFDIKRVRVEGHQHRPYIVLLRGQNEWRAAFLKYRGCGLDSRIWDQWAIRI